MPPSVSCHQGTYALMSREIRDLLITIEEEGIYRPQNILTTSPSIDFASVGCAYDELLIADRDRRCDLHSHVAAAGWRWNP